jgi:hypothetical protein
MDHVPESRAAAEMLRWIAYERDASWTAKLAILRARVEHVAYFGECMREHDRHADELSQLARAAGTACDLPAEPTFVTREPSVVGAIDDPSALLDAMVRLESARIERYAKRPRGAMSQPATLLDGLLERHQADARARPTSLRRLREVRRRAAA